MLMMSRVAEVFDIIEPETSRIKITKQLGELLAEANATDACRLSYMTLGELYPPYLPTQFNIAQKLMIRAIAATVDTSIADVEKHLKKEGDLGKVFEFLAGERRGKDVSLSELYETLEQVLAISGTGSQEGKEQVLQAILKQVKPAIGKYVIKIVLGTLRLGFSDMTLLDAFSWSVTGDKSLRKELEHAYNISADIGLIIATLKEKGIKGIEKISITPGIPIRPAAAERLADAQAIIKKIGPCVVQPKLDGFRLQVHKYTEKGKHHVRFFSRNLLEMSEMFPELITHVLKLKPAEFIVEGEAIAYDPETGSFLPFQQTAKRRRKYDVEVIAQSFPLKLFLFDALFMAGESLLDQGHEQRRKKLAHMVKQSPELIVSLIEEVAVETPAQLSQYFEHNVTAGLEGVVVKRPDAHYQPGTRNFNWIKLKREEEGGALSDTIDCVVLGYYVGHGKRASFGIGALLVGIYNKKKDLFQTIAKIGTGLTDEGWIAQRKACDAIHVATKPKNVECVAALEPDVWVDPRIICSIRADEITKSPLHTAGKTASTSGFALRFPRIIGYREDKAPEDATEVEEIHHLYRIQFQKQRKKIVSP